MSEWKTYKLNELGTIARGKSKHRPRGAAFLYGGPYPFIQTGDIKAANHRIIKHTQTYSEEGLKQSKLWEEGTICITIAANIADTSILTYPACFPDSVIGFIANKNICDVDFMEYLLQYTKRKIQKHAIGSVQDNINLGTFQNIELKIPNLITQRKIASILSCLDNKIELNLQTNQILEKMAQAIFKEWCMFNGENISNNWTNVKLDDLADVSSSKRIFRKEYQSKGVPFYRGKEISQLSKGENITTDLFISHGRYEEIRSKFGIPLIGDILITSVGTIGSIWMVDNEEHFYFKDGNVTWVKNYKTDAKGDFILHWLKSKEAKRQINSATIGSTQQALTISALKNIDILVPDNQIILKVTEQFKGINQKRIHNIKQIKELQRIRDTLLPKLMSGQLQVSEL